MSRTDSTDADLEEICHWITGELLLSSFPTSHSLRPWALICRYVKALTLRVPTQYLARIDRNRTRTFSITESNFNAILFADSYHLPLLRHTRCPTVLNVHNVRAASDAQRRPSSALQIAHQRVNLALTRIAERRELNRASAVTVTSADERRRLSEWHGIDGIVVGSGVNLPDVGTIIQLRNGEWSGCNVGWIGSDYGPNVEGLYWFIREAWPRIARTVEDARLLVAGKRGIGEDDYFAGQERVVAVGYVEDLSRFLAGITVGIAPLFAGAGIKMKTLTMMAHALPVVATSVGAEGLEDVVGNGVVVENDPDNYAAAVMHLLRHRTEARDAGWKARTWIEQNFTSDAVAKRVYEVIEGVVDARR
jgi:glycosyltransferase involved in cell wall biosynthesis